MITFYDTNDNDILIHDCSKVSKITLDFNKAKDTVYSDIKSVINEFSLYTHVNIKGKSTNSSVATENDVGGMKMAVKTATTRGVPTDSGLRGPGSNQDLLIS